MVNMMREILFRGKRIDNGEWVQGDLLQNVDCLKIREQEKDIKHIARSFAVLPETVGQYTGLTDKNGTKIFEGDILKIYGLKPMYVHFNGETLTWEMINVGVPIFEVNHLLNTIDLAWVHQEAAIGEIRTEVIGNIHDNPELLKGDDYNA